MLGLKLNHVSKRGHYNTFRGLLYEQWLIDIKTWMNNHIRWFLCDMIIDFGPIFLNNWSYGVDKQWYPMVL